MPQSNAADQEEATAPDLEWSDNETPIATRFNDPYYAREDGRAEAAEVFIAGNGFPRRWREGDCARSTIAELGFGTGLNFLETWRQWLDAGLPDAAQLEFVSFERWPMGADDIVRAIQPWPDLAPFADRLATAWAPAAGRNIYRFANVQLTVFIGDARALIADWDGAAHAWYLDGFSPAANPELWEADLLNAVFAHTRPGGTFSTYTAAGWVRRNLTAAGFTVEKVPGYGRKRERMRGVRPL